MKYVYAAATCGTNNSDGLSVNLTEGEAWWADDPFVRERPDLFTDEPSNPKHTVALPVIEQATAAPGERRNVRRS